MDADCIKVNRDRFSEIMEKVAVVIPIYKTNPDWNEVISLRQTMRVLGKYPLVLVCPDGLDVSAYEAMYAEANGGASLLQESFAKEYFLGIKGYNRLLLSECFFERFSAYEYILICQPDAFVFRDELKQWCEKKYDYIGAPLYGVSWDAENYLQHGQVGNGGFSLRRVDAYLRFFRGRKFVVPIHHIAKRINLKSKPYTRWFVWILMAFGWHNTPRVVAKRYQWNEDGFWSSTLNGTNYELRKPSIEETLEFAWERFPAEIYAQVGHLPFGCHAWEKYEFDSFWKKHIIFNSYKE